MDSDWTKELWNILAAYTGDETIEDGARALAADSCGDPAHQSEIEGLLIRGIAAARAGDQAVLALFRDARLDGDALADDAAEALTGMLACYRDELKRLR